MKIDLEKLICSLMSDDSYFINGFYKNLLRKALKDQGLEYKSGEIVKIEEKTSSNHTPIGRFQTCPKCGGLLIYDDPEFDWYKCEQCGKVTPAKELRDQPPLTEEQKAYYINGAISSDDKQCIDKSSCTSTKENNKPQTIKFNEPEEIDSVWPKEIVDELIEETRKNTPKVKEQLRKYFANVFPTIYDIDVDKMVEDFKEEESKVLLPLGFSKGNIEHLSIAYKNGLKDMLKLIKEGGEYK